MQNVNENQQVRHFFLPYGTCRIYKYMCELFIISLMTRVTIFLIINVLLTIMKRRRKAVENTKYSKGKSKFESGFVLN